jgi:hypothetical protein
MADKTVESQIEDLAEDMLLMNAKLSLSLKKQKQAIKSLHARVRDLETKVADLDSKADDDDAILHAAVKLATRTHAPNGSQTGPPQPATTATFAPKTEPAAAGKK